MRLSKNGTSQYEKGAGRFAHVGGLKYPVDPAAEARSRISDMMVMASGEWRPIDPAATYGVVSNNYMRGGGGYDVLKTKARNAYDFRPDLFEVVAAYLSAAQDGAYTSALHGRMTIE